MNKARFGMERAFYVGKFLGPQSLLLEEKVAERSEVG